MTVTKEITRLEKSNLKLTLTVNKNDIKAEYDSMMLEYTKTVQIPGFRKGKVPKEILVRKFGDALKQDVMGRIVEKALDEVMTEDSLSKDDRPLPYSRPEMEEEPVLDFEKDFQFSVTYDVLPKVNIDKWENFEIEIPDSSVTDDDLNRELEQVRERNAVVMDKDEGEKAVTGDVVTVNYCELDDEGNEKKDTERQDYVFTLGSGLTYYKFDDDVIGMTKGESRTFTKTYPEDLENKDLAGKTIKLKVTVTAVKIRKLPDLDDDLAQDVDEKFKTLDDLKKSIMDKLKETLDRKLKELKNDRILEKIMEATPVVIPDSMVNMELDSRWRNLARRFNTDAEGLIKIMEHEGQKAHAVLDEWRPSAVRALHSRLIVETLMENLKLEASSEEVEKEIDTIAGNMTDQAEQVRQYYSQEETKNYLAEEIKERKLFELLAEKNTVKNGNKLNYVDLMANNG